MNAEPAVPRSPSCSPGARTSQTPRRTHGHGGGSIRAQQPGLSNNKPCLPPRKLRTQAEALASPASVPLSCTRDRVRISVARPAGTPHLAGKKLHRAFYNTAKYVITSWASQRNRHSDLIKLILPYQRRTPPFGYAPAGAKQRRGSVCL